MQVGRINSGYFFHVLNVSLSPECLSKKANRLNSTIPTDRRLVLPVNARSTLLKQMVRRGESALNANDIDQISLFQPFVVFVITRNQRTSALPPLDILPVWQFAYG